MFDINEEDYKKFINKIKINGNLEEKIKTKEKSQNSFCESVIEEHGDSWLLTCISCNSF